MSEKEKYMLLDDFKSAPLLSNGSQFEGQELMFMRLRLADALENHPVGNVSREVMVDVFDTDRISEAISYEWRTMDQLNIWPGMDRAVFDDAIEEAPDINAVYLRIKLWEAVRSLVEIGGPDHSGWISRCKDKKGNPSLKLKWREHIKAGWADGAVIAMDATFSSDLAAQYFKRPMETLLSDDARMPNVSVLQTVDCTFGASSTIPANNNDDSRRENRAREIWRWIHLHAIQYRGQGRDEIDVIVICQMGLETLLQNWGLPDNVEIAHFNDIRGMDRWGGVRCLISVGRVAAKPVDVEDIAEAATGRAVTKRLALGEWYYQEPVGIRLADGTGWMVENDRHPDPTAEAVRFQICEAELIQAIGRARGVNRIAETPLQVDILTDVCLPIVVDQPIRWEDHAPGKIEEMVCRGFLPKSFAMAAKLYPDLWPTDAAARMAASRSTPTAIEEALNPNIPQLIYTIWGMFGLGTIFDLKLTPGLATVGGGKRTRTFPFLFDPAVIPDPAAWLTDKLNSQVSTLIGTDAEAVLGKRKPR